MSEYNETPIEQPNEDNVSNDAPSDDTEFEETDFLASDDSDPVPLSELTDNVKPIEDFTLAEALTSFFKRPRETTSAVADAIRSQDTDEANSRLLHIEADDLSRTDRWIQENKSKPGGLPRAVLSMIVSIFTQTRTVGFMLAFAFVLIGNLILAGDVDVRRSEDMQLAQGFPFVVLGFLVWLLTESFFSLPEIRVWWQSRGQSSDVVDTEEPERYRKRDDTITVPFYELIPIWRLVLAAVAIILSSITFIGTGNNTFSLWIFFVWILSIICWATVFAPLGFDIFAWVSDTVDRVRAFRWSRHIGVLLALFVILGMATFFRFHQLDVHPLEMTDDHVEKILDAGRVRDGARNIFFANNGGREPLQMYLIALVSNLPNFGINHDTIKFVSSFESLLTIPAMFWMGYALFEGESKRRRVLIALVLAGLVAASYWHVAISRQGLRIPLTALVVSLHLIYLIRGIRHNRRGDFVIAGLILGFGLYTYQAVRMLPVVIVVTMILTIIFNAKTFRERLRYVYNLGVLVLISFSVFIPMFRFSVDFPELFWRRTTGRLLGDDVIQERLADGTIIYRDASVPERFEAFLGNVPTIADNIRNVLLMFNWEGDVATISGVSTRPAMDVFSGSLLIVGLAAWLVFAIRKRDLAYWAIPLIGFLMLLPSALSIAFPHENPSHTRTSGAIPIVYLIASLPLVMIMELILDRLNNMRGKITSTLLCVLLIGASFNANRYLYFEIYPQRYQESFNPYSDAGRYLYGYVLTGGAYGNAFLIGYEHWWSHRAIGLEGGLEEFWVGGIFPYVNGEYSTEPIIQAIYNNIGATGTFQFDPNADLLFFFSPDDTDTAQTLKDLFPTGTATRRETYNPNEPFMVYEVPALGQDDFDEWILEHPPQ